MRAKHVSVGKRVRIISGVMRGEFGTIDAVQGELVSVRLDGDNRGYVFSQNELHLV